MKKRLLLTIFILIGIICITGCGKEEKKDNNLNNSNLSNLVNIEKIYYQEINDGSVSMYLIYCVNSDKEKDITLGSSAELVVDGKKQSSAFYTYDMNKNLIAKAGFPTIVEYKTLYGGSNNTLRYIATFTINKNYTNNNMKITLKIPYNGLVSEDSPVTKYEYLEKEFVFDDIKNFLYNDNSEFISEFEKDYNK